MTDQEGNLLNATQLAALRSSLHLGSANASTALASWIGRPSLVQIDSLDQLPLDHATAVLPGGDEPICFCSMNIQGLVTGEMILVFDDASGMVLADMLLDQPQGTTTEWTELAKSAALETTNIVCCAYLNSLSNSLSQGLSETSDSPSLVPAPPRFSREFAESLMEFALMNQAIDFDHVFLAKTRFEIDAVPFNWTLLFVPDALSISRLSEMLGGSGSES